MHSKVMAYCCRCAAGRSRTVADLWTVMQMVADSNDLVAARLACVKVTDAKFFCCLTSTCGEGRNLLVGRSNDDIGSSRMVESSLRSWGFSMPLVDDTYCVLTCAQIINRQRLNNIFRASQEG